MNCVKIFKLEQCEPIINDLPYFSGKQSEEIYHNMWCIGLEDELARNIKIEQLKHFIDRLIENRQKQINFINPGKDIIFYMWFDQQALQLRFNIMTGDEKMLPFGCKVHLVDSYESIINSFINMVKDVVQHGDEIQFFDKKDTDDWDDEENEEEFVLNVFVKKLT